MWVTPDSSHSLWHLRHYDGSIAGTTLTKDFDPTFCLILAQCNCQLLVRCWTTNLSPRSHVYAMNIMAIILYQTVYCAYIGSTLFTGHNHLHVIPSILMLLGFCYCILDPVFQKMVKFNTLIFFGGEEGCGQQSPNTRLPTVMKLYFKLIFSSLEPEAKMRFSDRFIVCGIIVVVNFSHFHLLLQNHSWANFN